MNEIAKAKIEWIIQTLIVVTKFLEETKKLQSTEYMDEFKKSASEEKNYYKQLQLFFKVMQGMGEDSKRTRKQKPKFNAVIFKGSKGSFRFDGRILPFFNELFAALNNIHQQKNREKLFNFSKSLAIKFVGLEFDFKRIENEKTPKTNINSILSTSAKAINHFIYRSAYDLHRILKQFQANSKAQIPAWHKKLIGQIFLNAGIVQANNEQEANFLDTSNYNDVANWIKRGKP